MNKLIIFDMDGTLLDTLAYTINIMNVSLEEMGYWKLGDEVYSKLLGASLYVMSTKLLDIVNPQHDDDEVNKMMETVSNNVPRWNEFRPIDIFPEVNLLLEWGIENRIKMAVLSNTPDDITRMLCEKYFSNIFQVIYGEGSVKRKPSAEGIFQIMKECQVDKTHTILIVDTQVDLKTAVNAGIPMVGVSWGCMTKEEWKKENIFKYATDGKELKKICEDFFR